MSDLNIDELIEKFGRNYPDWLNRSIGVQISSMDKTLKTVNKNIGSVDTNIKSIDKTSKASLAEEKKLKKAIDKLNVNMEKLANSKTNSVENKQIKSELTKLNNTMEKLLKSNNIGSLEKSLKDSMVKLDKSLKGINLIRPSAKNDQRIDKLIVTLQKMLTAQSRPVVDNTSKTTKENEKATEKQTNSIKKSTNENEKLSSSLMDRLNLEREYKSSLRVLNNDISRLGSSLRDNNLTGVIDTLGNSIASMSRALPLAGNMFGGVISGATAGIVALANEVLKTQNAYSQLSTTGIMLNNGFIGIRNAAVAGNLSIEQLTNAMTRNTSAFVALGTDAGRTFSAMSLMARQTDSSFRRLGMTTDQINEFLSDNLEYQRLGGRLQRMSDAERSVRAEQEVIRFSALSAAFGVSMAEIQRQTIEYAQTDEFGALAAYMDSRDPSGASRQEFLQMNTALVSMGFQGEGLSRFRDAAAQDIARRGGFSIPDPRVSESAALASHFATPEFFRIMNRLGQLDPENAEQAAEITRLLNEARENLRLQDHQIITALPGNISDAFSQLSANVAGVLVRTDGMGGTSGERADELRTRLSTATEPALKAVQEFENTMAAINARFSDLSTKIITLQSTQDALTRVNASLNTFAGRLSGMELGDIVQELFGVLPASFGFESGTLPSFELSAERMGWALAGWRLGGPVGAALAFALGPHMSSLMNNDLTEMISSATGLSEDTSSVVAQHGVSLLASVLFGFRNGGYMGAAMAAIAYTVLANRVTGETEHAAMVAGTEAIAALTNEIGPVMQQDQDAEEEYIRNAPQRERNNLEFELQTLNQQIQDFESLGMSVTPEMRDRKSELEGILSSMPTVEQQRARAQVSPPFMSVDDIPRSTDEEEPYQFYHPMPMANRPMAKGGVAVKNMLANIAEAGSPEMVLPLDPALHDMAKYIAEQHVEIAGPFYRRLNNELIYSLFRNNEDPIDKIFTKSLEKFLFSKAEVENTFMDLQRFSETGEELTPEIRNRLAIMGAMGIRPSEFASEYTIQTPRGVGTPYAGAGTPYAGAGTPYAGAGVPSTSVSEDERAVAIYESLMRAGFSPAQARSLTGEVYRENSFREDLIFGTHTDPHNRVTNLGIMSWQGHRRLELIEFLRERGLIGDDGRMLVSQEALDAQSEFLMREMVEDRHGGSTQQNNRVRQFLQNRDISEEEAIQILGHNFIRWRIADQRYAHHIPNIYAGMSILDRALQSRQSTPSSPSIPTSPTLESPTSDTPTSPDTPVEPTRPTYRFTQEEIDFYSSIVPGLFGWEDQPGDEPTPEQIEFIEQLRRSTRGAIRIGSGLTGSNLRYPLNPSPSAQPEIPTTPSISDTTPTEERASLNSIPRAVSDPIVLAIGRQMERQQRQHRELLDAIRAYIV